jgi:hypothetical protein
VMTIFAGIPSLNVELSPYAQQRQRSMGFGQDAPLSRDVGRPSVPAPLSQASGISQSAGREIQGWRRWRPGTHALRRHSPTPRGVLAPSPENAPLMPEMPHSLSSIIDLL